MTTHNTARRRQFELTVQKSRGLVYTTAVALGAVGKLLGVVDVAWQWVGMFLLVAGGTVLFFFWLVRRGVERVAGVPVQALWMAADVLIISWAVHISGGRESFWFVFYLTNVAAATYVAGVRGMGVVMAANTAAYLAVMGASAPLSWLLVAEAAGRKLLLYGAAVFALLGIPRLERRRQQVKALQKQAQERAEELARLAGELQQANAALRDMSMHDPLTGLPNRRFLDEHARADVSLVRRNLDLARRGRIPLDQNSSLGFLVVDLDHFKSVNDTYGHEAGDRFLVETGRTLRRAMRESDSVVRWGGEEFLVVARRVNRAFMWVIAERVRQWMEALRLKTRNGEEIATTCSVGYCAYPLGRIDVFSWQEVVALADAALLLAKRAGRNRSVGFEAGLRELMLGDRERVLRDPAWAVRAGFLTLVGEVPPALLEGQGASSGSRRAVAS